MCFLLLQSFTVFPKSISKASFSSVVFQLSHLRQQLNTSEPSQQRISLVYGNWHTPFLPRSNSFMQMFSPAVSGIITDSLRGKSKQQQWSPSLSPIIISFCWWNLSFLFSFFLPIPLRFLPQHIYNPSTLNASSIRYGKSGLHASAGVWAASGVCESASCGSSWALVTSMDMPLWLQCTALLGAPEAPVEAAAC